MQQHHDDKVIDVIGGLILVAIIVAAAWFLANDPQPRYTPEQHATITCAQRGGVRQLSTYGDFVVCENGKAYNLP